MYVYMYIYIYVIYNIYVYIYKYTKDNSYNNYKNLFFIFLFYNTLTAKRVG